MAARTYFHAFILALALFCAALFVQDATGSSRVHMAGYEQVSSQARKTNNAKDNLKGMKIGSSVPRCTYNECRGCKYKCSAKQVPVEGNDPINSPYHYRCVCHRW